MIQVCMQPVTHLQLLHFFYGRHDLRTCHPCILCEHGYVCAHWCVIWVWVWVWVCGCDLCAYVWVSECVCACVCACVYACVHVWVRVCMHAKQYAYQFACVCMCCVRACTAYIVTTNIFLCLHTYSRSLLVLLVLVRLCVFIFVYVLVTGPTKLARYCESPGSSSS